jgi:hypothetical protein
MEKPIQMTFESYSHPVVNINQYDGPEQSKDEIMKTRVTANELDRVDSFCRGRRINKSEYLRRLMKLDDSFFDHIDLLNQERDFILKLLSKVSKNF